jgi:hypothetical protein
VSKRLTGTVPYCRYLSELLTVSTLVVLTHTHTHTHARTHARREREREMHEHTSTPTHANKHTHTHSDSIEFQSTVSCCVQQCYDVRGVNQGQKLKCSSPGKKGDRGEESGRGLCRCSLRAIRPSISPL